MKIRRSPGSFLAIDPKVELDRPLLKLTILCSMVSGLVLFGFGLASLVATKNLFTLFLIMPGMLGIAFGLYYFLEFVESLRGKEVIK